MKIIDISVLTNCPSTLAVKNSVETAVVICDFAHVTQSLELNSSDYTYQEREDIIKWGTHDFQMGSLALCTPHRALCSCTTCLMFKR